MRISQWLAERTGKGSVYWMDRIGKLIGKCAKPIRGHPGLSACDPPDWLGVLTKQVSKLVCKHTAKGADENIAVSRVLSVILVLWVARINRAKCYDPRRSPIDRVLGMDKLSDYAGALMCCLVDESLDFIYFPKQEWDTPSQAHPRHEPDDMENKRQTFTRKKPGRK